MPTVTDIKPQKNKKRVNIYLDNKFGFGIDLETFVTKKIKVGLELTDKVIEQIVNESEFQKSYDKILRFGTLRPRSEKEFKNWLTKYKVHESLHSELFNRLKRLELLDDKKFAAWWIEQRKQFKSKSKRELTQELRMKGINSEIINQLITDYVSQQEQVASAKKLIEKRAYKWKMLEGYQKRQKIYSYLASKGFDSDVIREIVGEFLDD